MRRLHRRLFYEDPKMSGLMRSERPHRRSRTVLNVLMALCVPESWRLPGCHQQGRSSPEVTTLTSRSARGVCRADSDRNRRGGRTPEVGGFRRRERCRWRERPGRRGRLDGEDDSAGDKQSDQTDWEGGVLESPHPSLVNFDALRRVNGDIVGWIVGGETIDHPIVQGRDNDYYLSHMVNHERTEWVHFHGLP